VIRTSNFFFLFIPIPIPIPIPVLALRRGPKAPPPRRKTNVYSSSRSIRVSCYPAPATRFVAPSVGRCPALPLHYFNTTPSLAPSRPSPDLEAQATRACFPHSNNSAYNPRTQLRILGKTPLQTDDSHLQVPDIHTAAARFRHSGKDRKEGLLCSSTHCCVLRRPWTLSPQFYALALLGAGASIKPHSPHIRDRTHWLFSPTFSFLTRRFLLRPLVRFSKSDSDE
jgi:hypothetical protein